MSITVRQAIGQTESRRLDTTALRDTFLVEDLFAPGEIRMTYSHYDRTVVGSAVPTTAPLVLVSSKAIGSDPFLKRREMGVFNIGGAGTVTLDGDAYELDANDCLYIPMGVASVSFATGTANNPAKFYFISVPAHQRYPAHKITLDDANRLDLGSPEDANQRILRQYIHPDICQSCQLVMGMTAIQPGSVWNTMPCHVHDRRSELYLYFNMAPKTRVFHFMGEPEETRHVVVANQQVMISPGWSIHCGAGTGPYSFIWSMAGDNQDFTDMDMIAMEALR